MSNSQRKIAGEEEKNKRTIKQPENNYEMILARPCLQINVNESNSPMKTIAGWIEENKTQLYTAYMKHYSFKDTLKFRNKEKEVVTNGNQKLTQLCLSDKIYFKTKTVAKDEEGYYITVNRSIQQKNIAITNIYVPNRGAPKNNRKH